MFLHTGLAYSNGYKEYCSLPNYSRMGSKEQNEVYDNGWCVITGRSIVSPNPHRKYTLGEFILQCEKNESFKKRFIKTDDLREDKLNQIL